MNQSSYIAAFLLAGFVLFLAANNRLSAYAAVLWGTPSTGSTSSGSTGSAPTSSTSSTSSTSQSNPWSNISTGSNPLQPLLNAGGELFSSQALAAVGSFLGL